MNAITPKRAPTMVRGYSLLTVKAAGDGKRIITGVATTPTPDRIGDIIEPMGVQFKNPLPLLHQHNSREPVGFVKFDKPTKDGITFTAEFAKVDGPQELVDRIELAWNEVASGLVRGVSIGFRTLEFSIMEDGGWRYIKTEVVELSLVTIPANADCTIDAIKSFDESVLAAIRKKHVVVTLPGVSGPRNTPKPQEGTMATKTVAEQISAFEATRGAKMGRMKELMDGVGEAGTTLGAQESEEYDTLEAEVGAIDKHLKRLDALQKADVERAAPVVQANSRTQLAPAGDGRPVIEVKAQPKLDPGIRFARIAKSIMLSKLETISKAEAAQMLYGADSEAYAVMKAAVLAGTTISGNWAAALVGGDTTVFADFLAYLRPATILGKFGVAGVPQLRKVPFRERLIAQTGGGQGYWVGEGKPKPLTSFNFTSSTLTQLKVANICVLSDENIKSSSPASDAIVRDALRDALAATTDTSFIDPTNAGTSDVKPASITNGAAVIVSPGTDADDVRLGIRAVFQKFIDADNPPENGVWIMSPTNALALSLMMNALGQREFKDITMTGGVLEGLPVITSRYAGSIVALVNASDIWEADEGEVTVDMSKEASLEMLDSSLVQDATAGTGASLVSLWQNNLVGIRAERTINWKRARTSAVAYLSGVQWGGGVPNS